MVVTMHYEDGVEVFDTADRVDPAAYAGNALTNWSVRLEDARAGDALGGRRLWLGCRAHELPDGGGSATDGAGPGGLAVARRRDVAAFLLADESDVARLLRVAVDGDTVLIRIGGELANASRFAHAADVASVYAPQALEARCFLERAYGDGAEGDPEEAICSMMGLSPGQYGTAERGAPRDQGRFGECDVGAEEAGHGPQGGL